MFPILRQQWTLWGVWIVAFAIALFANPWYPFGWAELIAVVGSLFLAIDRRSRRETILAIGLPTIALLAVIDSSGFVVPRMVVAWFVFIGGVLLGARTIDDQIELESIAGHLALGPDPEQAFARFLAAVEAEVGRARRHERSFVVLSVAPHPRAFGGKDAGREGERVLARIAEARWMLELKTLLESEVHLYAHVVATDVRVLCLIPEVEPGAVEALVKRLARATVNDLGLEVAIGVATFPSDALAVSDLIEWADGSRRPPRLESVPSTEPKSGGGSSLRTDSAS